MKNNLGNTGSGVSLRRNPSYIDRMSKTYAKTCTKSCAKTSRHDA